MRLRVIRHFILYFAIGLSWGYVAKTIANHYLYTGFEDPQVIDRGTPYPIERLIQFEPLGAEDGEVEQETLPEELPDGTVSI